MRVIYRSDSGLTTIMGRIPERTFWGTVLILVREAVEQNQLSDVQHPDDYTVKQLRLSGTILWVLFTCG
jgi:hypothetical protein